MKKITFFDIEYANSKNKSICQIGIICEDYETGDPIYPELSIMVNPEDGFDDYCVKVHGITSNQVKDEPNFKEIWKVIEKYFTNAIIIGHNVASSDLDALVKNLRRYNLDIPEMYYICTMQLAKKYISRFFVENYSLSTLCNYYDIDIDNEHDAFDDACACSELFRVLIDNFELNLDNEVRKYDIKETNEFVSYISDPLLRKSISDFYGVIRGFSIDNVITEEEKHYIIDWKKEYSKYSANLEIKNIIKSIDEILTDGVVTTDEITDLQAIIQDYLDNVNTSPITLSTQILNGLIKGIVADNEITDVEVKNLRQWLYDNIYLRGHYPFDQLLLTIEKALSDALITSDELKEINDLIVSLLNPVEKIKGEINSVENKVVCLSGNFSYGQKSDVENYIIQRGGTVVSGVNKKVDILIIGSNECQTYSNGTYGTKVEKAMKMIGKGSSIKIIKESDFFTSIK